MTTQPTTKESNMSDPIYNSPMIATVTITPIGHDCTPAAEPSEFALDHQANAEVCESVKRMFERQFPAKVAYAEEKS